MPPNTHGRVQGKHSCEISWVTSQMTNLYWCKRQLLSCQSFKPLSVWLFIWLSVFARGTVAANCKQNAVTVYKWKTAANQEGWQKQWQHAWFGSIVYLASSIHLHLFSIWASCYFDALCCLEECEILWDRIHPCERNRQNWAYIFGDDCYLLLQICIQLYVWMGCFEHIGVATKYKYTFENLAYFCWYF